MMTEGNYESPTDEIVALIKRVLHLAPSAGLYFEIKAKAAPIRERCDRCHGTGDWRHGICHQCDGKGYLPSQVVAKLVFTGETE